MAEERYNANHHAGATPEARIANRLRNSGDTKNADHSVVHGTGPTRTHTNIHSYGQAGPARRIDLEKGGVKSGVGDEGERSISGNKRGVV